MTNPNFDWIKLLPESEQKASIAKLDASNEAFFKGFPIRPDSLEAKQDAAELRQAGIDGRAALDRAIAIVDARKETERLLNAAMDHIAGTLEQPADPRAWHHLLIYCPLEILEAAYVKKAQRL